MCGEEEKNTGRLEPFLRATDQVTVVVLVAGCLVSIVVYWYLQGFHRGQRIEIDHAKALEVSFEIDLNSAKWPELTLLPQVGEVMARRIVGYRSEHGPFQSVGQLENVKGIGPKTMRRIERFLIVVQPP